MPRTLSSGPLCDGPIVFLPSLLNVMQSPVGIKTHPFTAQHVLEGRSLVLRQRLYLLAAGSTGDVPLSVEILEAVVAH